MTDVMDKVQHIHEYCDRICNMRTCTGNYTLSTVSISNLDTFIVKVLSLEYPDIEKISVPKVSHLDFIVYVMSALGTWFGFVVIDIDLRKYFIAVKGCQQRLKNLVAREHANPDHQVLSNVSLRVQRSCDRVVISNQNIDLSSSSGVSLRRARVWKQNKHKHPLSIDTLIYYPHQELTG